MDIFTHKRPIGVQIASYNFEAISPFLTQKIYSLFLRKVNPYEKIDDKNNQQYSRPLALWSPTISGNGYDVYAHQWQLRSHSGLDVTRWHEELDG